MVDARLPVLQVVAGTICTAEFFIFATLDLHTLMANDRAVGGAIFGGSIIVIVIYAVLMLYAWEVTVRVTAFVGVALLLAILAWIGYTMATTPPPEPIADIPDVPAAPAAGSQPAEKKGAAQ